MEHVIAGTDFSIASINASRYAAMLADKIGVELTLFNLHLAPVVHHDSELEQFEHEKNEDGMRNLLASLVDDFPKVNIDYKLASGAFMDELSEVVKTKGNSILVFGIAPKSKFERYVYGSHATELAGKVNTPVIIVPRAYRDHKLEKIVLGVDDQSAIYNSRLEEFSRMLKSTGVQLKAVHVKTSDKKGPSEKTITVNDQSFYVETIVADNVETGLNSFVEKNNADMIVILSKTHSVFENIFSESHTKRVAFSSKVPVLAIHV